MNRQFSYELDERQIRIMMQNAELECSEGLWKQFDSSFKIEQVRDSSGSAPKFNFGLSRQILVPAFFVILICGLSAILFSFVDFKKKETEDQERQVPKQAIEMTANEVKREASPSQPTAQPLETSLKKDSERSASQNNSSAPQKTTTSPVVVKTSPVNTTVKPDLKKEEAKIVVKKEEPTPVRKRRRRQKDPVEDLPPINASIDNLNTNNQEPEPDIKLN